MLTSRTHKIFHTRQVLEEHCSAKLIFSLYEFQNENLAKGSVEQCLNRDSRSPRRFPNYTNQKSLVLMPSGQLRNLYEAILP